MGNDRTPTPSTAAAMRTMKRVLRAGLMSTGVLLAATAATVRAEHDDGHQPVARVELAFHRIIIHHDRDWGQGDISIAARVWEVVGDCGEQWWECDKRDLAKSHEIKFGAYDGQKISVDTIVPDPRGWSADASIGPGIGIPLYPGRRYAFEIKGWERDPLVDDELGVLNGLLAEQDNWSLGTRTERGWRGGNWMDDGFGHFCVTLEPDSTPGKCEPAHFSVEYELRSAPVADLKPTSIKVAPVPNSAQDEVCVEVVNGGAGDSGPFQVALRIGNPPAPVPVLVADSLSPGRNGEICAQAALAASSGRVGLSATVDEARLVHEYDETNNRLERTYIDPQGPLGGVMRPADGQVLEEDRRPDLVLSNIYVRGTDPTRPLKCEPGINVFFAVVKNIGQSAAGSFSVRMKVDGNVVDPPDVAVAGMDAGDEISVQFAPVNVGVGAHPVTATADITNKVAELHETNNRREATCQA